MKSRSAKPTRVEKRKTEKSKPRSSTKSHHKAAQQGLDGTVRKTRATSLASSRHAVLMTAELLELILLHLPITSIFTCQRVCKFFLSLITGSTLLQQRLWLQHADSPRQMWHWYCTGRETFFTLPQRDPGNMYLRLQDLTPTRLCPLLRVKTSMARPGDSAAVRILNTGPESLVFKLAFQPSASVQSYEKMPICDPPAFSAGVYLRFSLQKQFPKKGIREFGFVVIHRKMMSSEGLRLGDVLRKPLGSPYRGDGVKWSIHGRHYENKQDPMKLIQRLEKQYKLKAVLDLENGVSHVDLDGMVVPTEEEWRTVK